MDLGLSIDVSFDGGEVRYVERTPAPGSWCDGACLDSCESYYITFDPDQTQGTLSSESFVIADVNTVETLIAEGSISNGTTSGSIAIQFALSGEGGGAGVFTVRDW